MSRRRGSRPMPVVDEARDPGLAAAADRPTAQARVVVLAPPSRRTVRRLLRTPGKAAARWAYLGEDILRCLGTEDRLPGSWDRLEVAPHVRRGAAALRDLYIDYIGEMGERAASPEWWLRSLAEKNPNTSRAFWHLCRVKGCQDALAELGDRPQEPVVLFVEGRHLRRCLARNLAEAGCSVRTVGRWRDALCSCLVEPLEMVARRALFLARGAYRILLARSRFGFGPGSAGGRDGGPEGPFVLLITWVDGRSFPEAGGFADPYLGDLARRLERRGKRVAILPLILGTIAYGTALGRLKGAGVPMLLPHAFLRLRDLLWAALRATRLPRDRGPYPPLGGLDVSDLLRGEQRQEWVSGRVAYDLLLPRLVPRLREAGLQIERVIWPFENHTWARGLVLAFRQEYPRARLLGYQHTSIPPMQLNFFLSRREAAIAPLPDRIVTNGAYSAALLATSGYGPGRIVAGGALRYRHVVQGAPQIGGRAERPPGRPTLLLSASINPVEAAELIWGAVRAFGPGDGYRLLLKCHPATPFWKVARVLGMRSLPAHVALSEEPLPALLPQTDVMIYTSSTSCLEALALGVPVLHFTPSLVLDLDPLAALPHLRPSVATPRELAMWTRQLLKDLPEYVSSRRVEWRRTVHAFFGEVDEAVTDAFLERAAPASGAGRGDA